VIALEDVTSRLAAAGFVAAHDEAEELLDCAAGDGAVLASMLERRLRGEPLAWITGSLHFAAYEYDSILGCTFRAGRANRWPGALPFVCRRRAAPWISVPVPARSPWSCKQNVRTHESWQPIWTKWP